MRRGCRRPSSRSSPAGPAPGVGPRRVRGARPARPDPTSGSSSSTTQRVRWSTPALVAAVAAAAARHGAAIPVVPVAETLKRIDGELVGATVERTGLGAAQTPQGARRDLLREAWRRFPADGPETFTDEAALLEACSIEVHVVPGDPGNLKVTLPADLRRAALDARRRQARTRTGIGHDSHPFGPGGPLKLGGVAIHGRPGCRALGRRCRAPRRVRRTARGDRARRPRAPVPGRCADADRHRQHRVARGRPPTCRGGRLAAGHGRCHGRRGSAETRRAPRPDARCDRRAARAGSIGLSTSRPRPATSMAPRAPVDRSRRWPSPRSRRPDDASPARHAVRRDATVRPAAARTGSASIRAVRRSTGRPTSATSGPSCSRTCWSGTCAGAATR